MVGNKCVIVLSLLAISGALAKNGKLRRDWEPKYQHDPNTTPYCSWWYDNDGSITCKVYQLNPSITETCGNFFKERSYCVEAFNEPKETMSSSQTPVPTINFLSVYPNMLSCDYSSAFLLFYTTQYTGDPESFFWHLLSLSPSGQGLGLFRCRLYCQPPAPCPRSHLIALFHSLYAFNRRIAYSSTKAYFQSPSFLLIGGCLSITIVSLRVFRILLTTYNDFL
ncbi:uncharacterized protein MCYG_01257 [Microsporum canis CBS 113480]|uniref:Uncharacterized protein n=1 Tax=Arthroderma otae (strain ATCC MYA-4605 / CBS 113480) TaxID=554155 RepID=C5FEP5_ARTOC|nr:uncharacterized protein MCYG_01257 [Microsporum canis CBS 113480]EEQ28369.1 hypothetical protein MCYG_01257 [Microsporum canis CBS 113480]